MCDIIKEHLYKDPSAKTVVNLAKAEKTRQFWVEEDLLLTKEIYYTSQEREN